MELGNEPSNFQETPGTREAALSHPLHPVSQPVQFILLSFFPVSSLIPALRSLSHSFLSCSFCAWSSSFYCFLMANPSRFNSTFSLCASWLQFHCQLPNCLPCLCTDITHGCRPHVRVDLPGSGTSCQLGGGTDSGEHKLLLRTAPPEGLWLWWTELFTWTLEVIVVRQPCLLNHSQTT